MPWGLYYPAGRATALAAAYDATQAALAPADTVTPGERALIEALPIGHPQREITDDVDEMSAWDVMFTTAMRKVAAEYPGDLDIKSIFVEAIMNETPWQMWKLDTGKISEGAGTAEARTLLEGAFETILACRIHPRLLHLYVHLMEMSPFPELALRASDRLRHMMPDARHLVYMPTHIDVLCGNYHDVLVYNQRGIIADRKFLAREGALNVYAMYRTHNLHFAMYGAMFLGQFTPALAAAQELIDTTPEDLLRITPRPWLISLMAISLRSSMCWCGLANGRTSSSRTCPKTKRSTRQPQQ